MDELKRLATKYGGISAGSGINATPVTRLNQSITYYDPQSNTHFVQSPGTNQIKPLSFATPQDSGFIHKLGAIGGEALHLGKTVSEAPIKFAYHTGQDIFHEVGLLGNTVISAQGRYNELGSIAKASKQLDLKRDQLMNDFHAGKISKNDYAIRMRDLSSQYQDLSKRSQRVGNGPSATQRGLNVLEVGADILSLGKLSLYRQLEKQGAKQVVKAYGTKGIEDVFTKHASQLERAIARIPAVRDIYKRDILRQAKLLTGQTSDNWLRQNAKNIAVGLLIKRPIFYQTNIGIGTDAYNELMSGKYGDAAKTAAWLPVQMVSGGPLGWFFRNASRTGGKLRDLAVGKGSFIDELSKLHGTGSPAQISRYLLTLKDKAPNTFKDAEKTMRIMQEVNLQATDNNPVAAAKAVMEHYVEHGIDPANLTTSQLIADMKNWARADELAQQVSKKLGYNTPDGKLANLVAVRWDTKAKNALAAAVKGAGNDLQARLQVLQEFADRPGVGWGNNRILMSKLEQAIQAEDPVAAIKAIQTASTLEKDLPKKVAAELKKLGYTLATPWGGRKTPALAYEDTRKLVSAITRGDTELFDETIAPKPSLQAISGVLRKFGLTPEQNNAAAMEKLSQALVADLERVGMDTKLGLTGPDTTMGGKYILSRLQDYVNRHQPSWVGNMLVLGKSRQSALQDIRQMTPKEIREALNIGHEEAVAVQKAVIDAYSKVPLEFRGLGVKAFDKAFKVPGFKYYNRIQGALRYTYNPFFRAQELIETKTLSHLKANNLVWMKPKSELDRVAKLLDESQIFTTGYTGEQTQDLVLGRLHPNLLKTQRRDLSGLALDIANRRGIPIEQMIQDHPDELADALKVVVQYPSRGVLNSPLARTLNIAFFPMRYNLKVAALMAGEVAKMPPTVQTAFLHSMLNFKDWVNSDEGIKWRADNADVIGLLAYFSPLNNMAAVFSRLTGRPYSVSDFGLLGGLPFGAISQILDSEGIINLQTPYVNPKTGDVLPEYIPQTARARAATAVEGLLNSMFTYPGRIIGMPGKSEQLRNVTNLFIKTNGSDYIKRLRSQDLTPIQQHYIDVLTNPNVTQDDIDRLFNMPADGEFNWYTIPPLIEEAPVHQLTRVEVLNIKAANKAAKAAAKKAGRLPNGKFKALPIPPPGQNL